MTMRFLYWLIMVLWVLGFGLHSYNNGWNYYIGGGSLMFFLLFLLLGWKVFGPPVEG